MPYNSGRMRDEKGITKDFYLFAEIMKNVVFIDNRFDDLVKSGRLSDQVHKRLILPLLSNGLTTRGIEGGLFPPHYAEMSSLINDKLEEWGVFK